MLSIKDSSPDIGAAYPVSAYAAGEAKDLAKITVFKY
jgi:hypothetical protein